MREQAPAHEKFVVPSSRTSVDGQHGSVVAAARGRHSEEPTMKESRIGKYTGTGLIDAQSIKSKLVDIRGGDLQGYQRQKPGFELVLAELVSVMATNGDEAGIHASVYQGFTDKTTLLTQIRTLKPAVAKLYEVLCERFQCKKTSSIPAFVASSLRVCRLTAFRRGRFSERGPSGLRSAAICCGPTSSATRS